MFDSKSGLLIESSGKVRLNEENTAIESLAQDGYVMIVDKNTRKEVYIERDKETDEIVYSYYIKGRMLPFEGEGEKWLKSVWSKLVEAYK